MAATSFYSIMAADGDANFRIWGKAISDALQTVATKLSSGDSSGQIDWTSVSRPGASNTVAGYEMYKFTDSLSASYPVYIKVEYGTGTFGAGSYYTSIWITVGFAHNGAGTLTGYKTTIYQYTVSQNYAVTVYASSFVSGSTNRLAMSLRHFPGSGTNQPWVFTVERTHNSDGTDTNYGVAVVIGNGAGTWKHYLLTYTSGVILSETVLDILCPTVGHGSAGGTTAIYPVWTSAGPFICPLHGIVFAFTGNVTSGVPFSVSLLGGSKTFMPLAAATDSGISVRGVLTLIDCIRFD